jgi:hypothetical protein
MEIVALCSYIHTETLKYTVNFYSVKFAAITSPTVFFLSFRNEWCYTSIGVALDETMEQLFLVLL